jgi:hypothetical protein
MLMQISKWGYQICGTPDKFAQCVRNHVGFVVLTTVTMKGYGLLIDT